MVVDKPLVVCFRCNREQPINETRGGSKIKGQTMEVSRMCRMCGYCKSRLFKNYY